MLCVHDRRLELWMSERGHGYVKEPYISAKDASGCRLRGDRELGTRNKHPPAARARTAYDMVAGTDVLACSQTRTEVVGRSKTVHRLA